MDAPPDPGDLKATYATLLQVATGEPCAVTRIYPPREPGGQVEILFLAGTKGDQEACTAYVLDNTDEPPVICSGW